jgi:hypothetical protein
MLLTLGEIRQSSIVDIAGACNTSDKFRSLVNEAVSRLLLRGDWPGSIVPIHVCVYNGCAVFPRYVGQIRKVNRCGESVPVKSIWYQFLDMNLYHDKNRHGFAPWVEHEVGLQQQARSPVFQDIQGDTCLVRAYPRNPLDVGKTVTIFGIDTYGQPLITKNADGTWADGVIITLAAPYGSTSAYVRRIDRVLKDQTQGIVDFYAYNAVTNVLQTEMGHYDPSETNPSYAKYTVHLGHGQGSCCSSGLRSIVALVKLKHIPVIADTDLIPLEYDALSALKFAVQSIKFAEAGDRASAQAYLADAIAELNRLMQDTIPDDQIPVSINPFGSTCLGRQHTF